MLEKYTSNLPDKIRDVIVKVNAESTFICAMKTALKPSATIPLLWIVITQNKLLLCNTHRTRGLSANYSWNEINCIRRTSSSQTAIEIIFNSLEQDDIIIPLPATETATTINELTTICSHHTSTAS